MPHSVYEGAFSLPLPNHEAALLICSDCSLTASKDSYHNAVEIQLSEGAIQKQADRLTSLPLSKLIGIIDRDCRRRPTILSIDAVQFDLADQPPRDFYYSRGRIGRMAISPCFRCTQCHGDGIGMAQAEHSHIVRAVSQPKSGCGIIRHGGAEAQA